MRIYTLLCAAALVSALAQAQIKVTGVERLALGNDQEWCNPQFSPDGKSIYLGGTGFDGIWRYDLAARKLEQVTADPQAGRGFSLSADGSRIAYRRTSTNSGTRRRTHEAVILTLADRSSSVIASGRDVSLPAFSGGTVLAAEGATIRRSGKGTGTTQTALLGIEKTRIAVVRNGSKVLLDPLGRGSYIWPSVSPDGKRIVAYEIDRGAFICDFRGRVLVRLGRRDAPCWSRDGRWIIYMQDQDDGARLLESEIACVSTDGKRMAVLTQTPGVLEMHPRCSPVQNRIVCDTPAGEVYLLRYEEGGR